MTKKRVLVEFGMGSSLRRSDYTGAAVRAVKDALWHNSINVAELFGFPKSAMLIDVEVGVQDPDSIDADQIAAIFPYGNITILPKLGGLDVSKPGGGKTVIANVAIAVSFYMESAT